MPLLPINLLTHVAIQAADTENMCFHITYHILNSQMILTFLCKFISDVKFEIDWYVKIKVTVGNIWTRFKINFSLWKFYIVIDKLSWGNCWKLLNNIIVFNRYYINSNLLLWSLEIFYYVRFCHCKLSGHYCFFESI